MMSHCGIQKVVISPGAGDFFHSYLTGGYHVQLDDSGPGFSLRILEWARGLASHRSCRSYIGPSYELFPSSHLRRRSTPVLCGRCTVLHPIYPLSGQNLPKLKAGLWCHLQATHGPGLVLEHDKSEVFHFSRLGGVRTPL